VGLGAQARMVGLGPMTRLPDIHCPPYVPPKAGNGTILELAARAGHAVNRYRATVDNRGDFDATIRAAAALSRATQDLTTAIADAVACGDNSLS
jgi:hypothetical protein